MIYMLNKSITTMVLILSVFMASVVHSIPQEEPKAIETQNLEIQRPLIDDTLDVAMIITRQVLTEGILEAFGGGTGITPIKIGEGKVCFEIYFFEPRKEERVSREEAGLMDIFQNREYTRLSFNENGILGDDPRSDQRLTPESLLTHITITVNTTIRTSV